MANPGGATELSEESLFTAAMALPAPERLRYLEKVCHSDKKLLSRLQRLVAASANAALFVKDHADRPPFDGAGDMIGRYRLLEVLGEGGCGIVYAAEQVAPLKRQIAIKLIKPGTDTKSVLGRFEVERQALALMDHPHIAKVLDAGESPTTGRPYFVLELVRGSKVTDYANQSRLGIAERLTLFMQTCQAIQHAHQKGIIHRDIKPGNVLVTMHDGVALVKVIDFGLARVLNSSISDRTTHTSVEQFIGTPIYASPEQAESSQADVDTRSDIYSLGVLLYELLTNLTPFDAGDFLRTRFGRVQRIRLEEPAPPSKRLASVSDISVSAATQFGTSAANLWKQLRGDLDCIVMRCIETDRARRYQSVNELINDIDRYLRHENISARPPSLAYTVRKFARRHRVLFATYVGVLGFIILAVCAAITLSLQARRLSEQRDRAEAEQAHAEEMVSIVSRVLTAADPFKVSEREVTNPSLLDEAAQELMTVISKPSEGSSTRLAELVVPLLQTLGRTYMRLGEAQKAIPVLQRAMELQVKTPGGGDSPKLGTMVDLSNALRLRGDIAGAQRLLIVADGLAKEQHLEDTVLYAKLLLSRGHNAIFENKLAESRRDLEQSLALTRQFTGPVSVDVAEVLLALSRLAQWTDALTDAERMAREAVTIFERSVSPMYPDRVYAEARLAEVLYLRNQVDLAEPLFVDSLRKQRQILGRNNWLVADAMESLARIRRSQGRTDDAEALLREAVMVHSAAVGEEHPMSGYLRTSLAALLLERKKYREAELQLRQALRYQSRTAPSEQYIASSEYLLGEVLLASNQLSGAQTFLESSIDRLYRADAPAWRAARSASALGEVMYRQGRASEAARLVASSYAILESSDAVEREIRLRAKARFEQFSTGAAGHESR